jgi:hypothetical protein
MGRKPAEPDAQRLVDAGWIRIDGAYPWVWKEPKTRALYTYNDAVDLLNVKRGNKEC